MLLKIFKKDVTRNYIVLLILFVFMTLSVVLVSSGTFMINKLYTSVNSFFEKAEIPHVVQMHAGEVDPVRIQNFSQKSEYVKEYQLSKMLSINSREIVFNNQKSSNTVMDISFVKQNISFDFLLNSSNMIELVKKNHIGVPIYYKKRMDLKIGDTIKLENDFFEKEFTIQYFLRDAQMNAPIISSKRFLINPLDYEIVEENINASEYLIEFILWDQENIEVLKKQYLEANLPNKGPIVDQSLFKVMNAISDGMIAVVIIFVSLLLMMVALLCIRFSIITTIEEDFESIGVMKTIGFQYSFIKRIYHFKYILIAVISTILGYFLSYQVSPVLTKNISLYMGGGTKNIYTYILPFIGSLIIMFMMIFFCGLIINRFKKVSTIETLQSSKINKGERKSFGRVLSLSSFSKSPVNVFLAIKDVFVRSKMYSLLAVILIICLLIVLIPYNFLTTLSDSSFTSYMGIGESDIRIDIQNSEDVYYKYEDILRTLQKDPDIKKVAGYVTSQYEVLNSEGYYEGLNIEVGDFTRFPIQLLEGQMPSNRKEIALSKLNADNLNVSVNDKITLHINDKDEAISVTGIYQDITNGGKTAKGIVPIKKDQVMWQSISIDLYSDTKLNEKIEDLNKRFPSIKVTGIKNYIGETFKETVNQVRKVISFSGMIAVALLILITSLFTKMIVVKDQYEISILKSIGITERNIIVQYLIRIIMVSIIAIVIASLIGNTFGASVVSLLMSFLGASKIVFVINPLMVYLKLPLGFIVIVTCVTLVVTQSIKKIDVNQVFN